MAESCGGPLTAVYVEDPLFRTAAALADLTRFVRRTLGAPGADRVKCVVVAGAPGRAIVREARRLHADVIVVGTSARHGAPKLLVGSTAESVLRHAESAVLVVPPHCHAPLPGWPAGSISAAVAVDGYRRTALACAARMAEVFAAWLSVIPATPAAARAAGRRSGLVLYPQPHAGFAGRFRHGGEAYRFICASRVPVLVIRTGRRYGTLAPSRRAA